jgi:hypothetical protein
VRFGANSPNLNPFKRYYSETIYILPASFSDKTDRYLTKCKLFRYKYGDLPGAWVVLKYSYKAVN